jgi:hypothetical protein
MRSYLLVTAIAFALLVFAHVWRMLEESTSLARDPWFVIVTLISASLSAWAFRLWKRTPRSS